MNVKSEFASRVPGFKEQSHINRRKPRVRRVQISYVISAGLCRLIQSQKSSRISLKQQTHRMDEAIVFFVHSQNVMARAVKLQEESM